MRITLALVLFVAAVARGDTTIGWEEAAQHAGEEVTVDGRVLGVHCSPTSCLLAFEPTFNGFTAVIQAERFGMFPPGELDRRFNGRRVRVHGTIVVRDRKPEIQVDTPEALVLAEAPPEDKEEKARAMQDQAEALGRLADALERIETLAERLATVQERMEALLSNLEQREAALAAAQVSQPAPGPPSITGYATPAPPRAGYDQLRTVKRGMARGDVERLAGEPQFVEQGGGGWVTWHYGGGRSVTFDGRGRATAVVGFSP